MSDSPVVSDMSLPITPLAQADPGADRRGILVVSRLKKWLMAVALGFAALAAWAGDLPDPRLTPGSINPDVTQENIRSTVCVKGWTKTVRPPAYYTNKLKKEQIREYGYADRNPKDYEEDHLIPLGIGGNPTDRKNLWPEPRNTEWGAGRKDQLEFAMYKAVCRGEISLEDARLAFATNWIEAYKKYGILLGRYRNGHAD